MNIKIRNILIISIITIMAIIVMPNKANAGLQANKGGKSLTNTTPNNYFKAIRRMETQNGTLGKTVTFDDKYVDTTGNGIDCHMALSTEFGTAGILSYSKYGTITTSTNDTTTGNESGIKQLGHESLEYVAGIYPASNSNMNVIFNADARYYNKYESYVSKAGDGIGKFGVNTQYPSAGAPILRRGCFGVLYSNNNDGSSNSYGKDNGSRAVVVCGEGL